MATDELPLRVHIVDDDSAIHQSVQELIAADPYEVVCYRSHREFIDGLKDPYPGSVLLDVALPDGSGLEACRELRDLAGYLPVLIFTGHASVQVRYEAMKYGAIGLIEKPSEPASLRSAIRAMGRLAEDWWNTYCFEQAVAELSEPGQSILGLISNGATAQAVCNVLGMSQARMESHVGSALATLGVASIDEFKARLQR